MRKRKGALPGAPVGGVDAPTSAWATDLCGKEQGKELPQEDAQKRAAQERELAAWKELDAFQPVAQSIVKETIVDVR